MDFKNFNWFAAFVALYAVNMFVPRESREPPRVSVSGECLKRVVKDRTAIILEIRNLRADASAAVRASTETYNGISDYMKGVRDANPGTELETTRMDTYDKYEWSQSKKRNEKLGVESVIGLEISTSDSALIGGILSAVSKNKDVYTNGLRTYVSKELLKSEQEACMSEAVKNARARAESIASANGQGIGPMVSAGSYQTVSRGPGPVLYKARVANMMVQQSEDEAGAPSIFSGAEEISVTVNAEFKLR